MPGDRQFPQRLVLLLCSGIRHRRVRMGRQRCEGVHQPDWSGRADAHQDHDLQRQIYARVPLGADRLPERHLESGPLSLANRTADGWRLRTTWKSSTVENAPMPHAGLRLGLSAFAGILLSCTLAFGQAQPPSEAPPAQASPAPPPSPEPAPGAPAPTEKKTLTLTTGSTMTKWKWQEVKAKWARE